MEDYSKFQFNGFKIIRSLFERKSNESSKKITLNFDPKGYIDKQNGIFQLNLDVKIEDENKSFIVDISSIAYYKFENIEGLNNLSSFFFVNAPALLFPYLRAYISTITNLSGFEPINLPTLNMTSLGNDLKNNTSNIE